MVRLICLLTLVAACTVCEAATEAKATLHVVRSGDTLSEIAQRYRVKVDQLVQWNDLPQDRIYAGQRLSLWLGGDWYRVRSGDTLSEIAQRFSLSPTKLRSLNGLSGDRIQIGQKLQLRSAPVAPPAPPAAAGYHVVRRGENLSRIAQQYGVRVAYLRQWNGLRSDAIQAGQQLRVQAPNPAPHPA